MRRCIVPASLPALSENTFAARPVGAISTTFCRMFSIARTMAPASDVLPVPAEPLRIITLRLSGHVAKLLNTSMAAACSSVGVRPSTRHISSLKMSFIISFSGINVAKSNNLRNFASHDCKSNK